MANEHQAAGAADKAGGKPAHRSRHRSGRSGRPAAGAPVAKSGLRWTWRDYALQLSVVVIGIVVTFAGSGLIERWQRARQVRTTMLLVYEELKTNLGLRDNCCEKLRFDQDGMLMFDHYGRNVDLIPTDSLDRYVSLLGTMRGVDIQNDAFEVLKSSGAIQFVGDKELLMKVLGCYRQLATFKARVDSYNQSKINAINHFSAGGLLADFHMESRKLWRALLYDPVCNSFIGMSAYYVGYPDYLRSDIAGVEKTIAAINDKYRFE